MNPATHGLVAAIVAASASMPLTAQATRVVALTGTPQPTQIFPKGVIGDGTSRYLQLESFFPTATFQQWTQFGLVRVDATTNQPAWARHYLSPDLITSVSAITDDKGLVSAPPSGRLFVLTKAWPYQPTQHYLCEIDKATGNLAAAQTIPNAYAGSYERHAMQDLCCGELRMPNASAAEPSLVIVGTAYRPITAGLPYSKLTVVIKNLLTGSCQQQEILDTANPNWLFDPKQVLIRDFHTCQIVGTVKDMATGRRYGFYVFVDTLWGMHRTEVFDVNGHDVRDVGHFHWDGIDFVYGQLFWQTPSQEYEQNGSYFIRIGNGYGLGVVYDLPGAPWPNCSILTKCAANNEHDVGAFLAATIEWGPPFRYLVHVGVFNPTFALGGLWNPNLLSSFRTYELSGYAPFWGDPQDPADNPDNYLEGYGAIHVDRDGPAFGVNPTVSSVIARVAPGFSNPQLPRNTCYWQEIDAAATCEVPYAVTSTLVTTGESSFTGLSVTTLPAPTLAPAAFTVVTATATTTTVCGELPPTARGRVTTPPYFIAR